VINSQGKCSTGRIVLPADKQQRMLEREGVKFDTAGRCDLEKFLWKPKRNTSRKSVKARTLYKK
jgi:methylated-DNA-protein-cysteine methyltransferase-like protein